MPALTRHGGQHMSSSFGPILSFRGIKDGKYEVSALWAQGLKEPEPKYQVPADVGATLLELDKIPINKPSQMVWRLDMQVQQTSTEQVIEYMIGGQTATFNVPQNEQAPRIAYVSCSGVSDYKHLDHLGPRYAERWSNMSQTHKKNKYHLLIMGGDQIYSDPLLKGRGHISEWHRKFSWNRDDTSWTLDMETEADNFFASVYQEHWAKPEILEILKSIPTIMMWDDHDIIDGWGSYPQELHECAVHRELFRIATNYFRIFQQQLKAGERHPGAITKDGFTFGFQNLGNMAILVPDLRSERSPDIKNDKGKIIESTQVLSQNSIKSIFKWIDKIPPGSHTHLLFISSIPVAFVNLALLEALVGWIPGEIGPEDDFRDHWRHQPHRRERTQLIVGLLDFAEKMACKVTIVSGDVHVAAASIIRSSNTKHGDRGAEIIYQLISTGVVHPPLPPIAIKGLEAITKNLEKIDTELTAEMQPIGFDGNCLIAKRNWLSIEPDEWNDQRNRLWVKWFVEGHDHPITRLIEPVRLREQS